MVRQLMKPLTEWPSTSTAGKVPAGAPSDEAPSVEAPSA